MNNDSILEDLINELKADCNRYVNKFCSTSGCLKRGGYKLGDKVDYEIATCKRHEQVKALEELIAKKNY